jgi:16S rRNA (guanine966-N2)-methyltransferase
LVESNKQAAAVCIQNSRLIQDALFEEDHEVVAKVQIQPVQKFLESNSQVFDLVFIDPPYEITNQEVEQNLEILQGSLSKNALVLVERSARAEAISADSYELLDTKNFGDTVVYWLRPN